MDHVVKTDRAFLTALRLTSLLGLLAIGIQAADKSLPLLHPDRLKGVAEIQGTVANVETDAGRLMVQDSAQQRVSVHVSSETRTMDAGNETFAWTSLKSGDPVTVYYAPKSKEAIQIDRGRTTSEGLLGIDHPAK